MMVKASNLFRHALRVDMGTVRKEDHTIEKEKNE